MGKSSSSPAPTPDPAIGAAAIEQANLGHEQLAMAKEQFGVENARQDRADTLTDRVTTSQLAAQDQATAWAAEDRGRVKSVFQPQQDAFIAKANNWDNSDRQAAVAAEARAGVMSSAANMKGTTERNMAASGIAPGSGRYDGNERAMDQATALGAAGAENTSRSALRSQAMALQGDAVNMGNGLAASASTSLGVGVNAGSAAVGATTTNNAAARANVGTLNSGYAGAQAGIGQGATTLGSLYSGQQSAYQSQKASDDANSQGTMKAVGTVAMMAAMMMSSKKLKTDKKPSSGHLKAVKSMPVEDWTYKAGVEDEGRHTGVYAEDFKKATGRGDGKSIAVVDAMGVTMGAVQELDTKVDKLVAVVSKLAAAKGRGLPQRAA